MHRPPIAVLALALAGAGLAQERAPRPNVVLVMTDDQGLGDFGCQGNPVLETPRLDAFARQCPQFERFYVSPVCSPTRASLMTGRYNYRTRVVDTWIGRSMMEPDEVTVAEVLREVGYRTGIFGKWHLGDCYPQRPIDQGFDEALVHRGGGIAQPSEPRENRRRYTDPLLLRNGEVVATKGYCTDVYFDAAMRFVDDAIEREQPFFTYIATNAPHGPFHDVPNDLLAKYLGKDLKKVAIGDRPNLDRIARIFAMIENIDQNFGRLLDHLDRRGVADDTVVIFLCDNGPIAGRFVQGLRGAKTSVHEGGIRSPLWVRLPGRNDAALRIDRIAAHIDVMPTICELADAPLPDDRKVDGRSLLPLLQGRRIAWPDRPLVLQTHRGDVPKGGHHFALVGQRWKLLRHSGFGKRELPDQVPLQLFDLQADPGEARDVAAAHPDVVARLLADYRAWFADVSATRPDNYAKPRIVVGDANEPVTVLTRQDWVPADGVGWGHDGCWLLRLERARKVDVTVVFREQLVVERTSIQAGGKPFVERMVVESDRITYENVPFAVGDVDLQITCTDGTTIVAPYQVILTPR
ncbi:MAG: arylsulfatase [Planctomycetota bacterium]